jgi:hypothetical protein
VVAAAPPTTAYPSSDFGGNGGNGGNGGGGGGGGRGGGSSFGIFLVDSSGATVHDSTILAGDGGVGAGGVGAGGAGPSQGADGPSADYLIQPE